jgi:hypothetical protein
MTRAPLLALALAIACFSAACSTTYSPRPSGRIGVIIDHGAALYVKDGQRVPIGPLGGDLGSLVGSSPAAAARARRAHGQLAAGVPIYVGGIATLVIGLALSWTPLGWIVVGVGATSIGSGLGLMGAGFTNAVDAINIHNDAVGAPGARP